MMTSIRGLFESAVVFLATKAELVGLELEEEKRRIFELLVLATAFVVFGALALTLITLSVVYFFWDTNPRAVLLIVAGLYTVLAVILFLRLRYKMCSSNKVLEATVEELKKDSEWIKRHL